MPFGGRLRELRQNKGLTLRALAEIVGLDFTYLSKIENGRVEYTPSADTIRALARALGADALELLALAGKAPPELGAIVSHPSARAFLRRAQGLTSPEDWEDLLNYLDQRQAERNRKKGGEDR